MSLKVSSGLKASAQEWKPSFATPTTPATPAIPASTAVPSTGPPPAGAMSHNGYHNEYYVGSGEYYGPSFYNGDSQYGFYADPWAMATTGSMPRRHGQQRRRNPNSHSQGQVQNQSRQHHPSSTGVFPGSEFSAGVTKTKKRKKKKKKGLPDVSGRNDTMMKPVEIKPNRILVFKNLPFSFTVEQLEDIIDEHCGLTPATTSFHRDKNGQFKGFCFVYFDSIESATRVLEGLNGYDLQGRKWSVEYKRVNIEDNESSPATLVPHSSLVRSGSHGGGKSGSLSSLGMGVTLCSMGGKQSTIRDKFRSVSESDADMNWRRTRAQQSDFPPKHEAGRRLYQQLLAYKEQCATDRKSATLGAHPSTDGDRSGTLGTAPLRITILPSDKVHQRVVQECLRRLNLNHRIKDEAGEQITYEITPRAEGHGISSLLSTGSGGAGAAGRVVGERRRSDAGTRESTGATLAGQAEKTIKAPKYANVTVAQAAEQQLAELSASPRSSDGGSPGKSPLGGPDGTGMGAYENLAVGGHRTKDRGESHDFGCNYASGPDGSTGFLSGPRGRLGCSPRTTS